MANEAYREKLRDPRWQKMRLQILERDHWACQICYDTDSTLHVHHRYYESGAEPWDYPPTALVTLCVTCHEGETNASDWFNRQLPLAVKKAGAFASQVVELCGAFVTAHDNPMDDTDWSILHYQICILLEARNVPEIGRWTAAITEHEDFCRRMGQSILEKPE